MRKIYFLLTLLFSGVQLFSQNNVGIGTPTPLPSAILDLTATDKGFLAPRVTNAQMNAIASPANGLTVYNTDQNCIFYYDGSVPLWKSLCNTLPTNLATACPTAASGYVSVFTSPTEICNSVIFQQGNNVGINTTNPVVALQINATSGLGLPTGTTAQQPAAAPAGTIRYNSTTGAVEVFTGTCWQNVNTPPIGATYVQWFNAADPNTVYPCTQWVSSDIANGEFIRSVGGLSNVATPAALSGVVQNSAVQDHAHTATGTAAGAGVLTSSADGAHNHNWGGWWSNDDSRDWATTNGNGDGNGNTVSDFAFWWGGNPGTTASTTAEYNDIAGLALTTGAHNHGGSTGGVNNSNGGIFIPYDDNLSDNCSNTGWNDDDARLCGQGWNGKRTAGNFMGNMGDGCFTHTHSINNDGNHAHSVRSYAHRHFLKQRPTSDALDHTHTIADHTHTLTINVGNMSSGTSATETRPTNVAVVFWRRIN